MAEELSPDETRRYLPALRRLRGEVEKWKRATDRAGEAIQDISRQRGEAQEQAAAERERADKAEALIREFVAARDEYIVAINNCHPDRPHDYWRWQGHAEARRQLGARLAELRTEVQGAEELSADETRRYAGR